jgi:surface antigen
MSRRFKWSLYSGTAAARLWRRLPLLAPVLLGIACGGCSLSYQFDSLVGKSDKTETTGSIKPVLVKDVALPPERDLAYTRVAVADALNRGTHDVSLPWENPDSGARGTVTPIASAYNQDGVVCRDFLASYVSGSVESWMRGEACSPTKGKWEVRSMKPWTRS